MNPKALFFLLLLAFPLFTFSQTIKENIAKAYTRFERDSQMDYGISSLTVLDAETGELIFSRNENTGLAPASSLKTITSATAFYLLGEGFTWKTSLGYTGKIVKGVLDGDLILTGTGDPTLGSERYAQSKSEVLLKRWINAIRDVGIKQVKGRVIADDRLYGTQTIPLGWIWQDIGNYYGAGSSSVCWNENQFEVVFKPGAKPGDLVQLVRTEPAMPYLTIVNEVTTGKPGSGDNVYAYSAPYSDIVYLRGTYGIDLTKKVGASVPDPAFEASYRITEALQKAGIKVENEPETARRLAVQNRSFVSNVEVIDVYNSPSLAEVIYWLNKKSINLYAENLLKAVAVSSGREGNTAEGVEVMQEFWNRKLNIDKLSLNVLDGSGLSPEDRVTTLTMAKILQSDRKEPWFDHFYESLPVYNDMRMKSGTMRNVLAYGGYHTSNGVKLVFSFLVNNHNGTTSAIRQKMFKVLDELK